MNAFLSSGVGDWWQLASWTMLHFLWLGTLAGLVALVLRLAIRRASAKLRYGVAVMCLALLAAMPVGIAAYLGANAPAGRELAAKPQAAGGAFGGVDAADAPAVEPIAAPLTVAISRESATNVPELKPSAATARQQTPSLMQSLFRQFESLVAAVASHLPWLWIIGTPLTFLLLTTGLVGAERLRRSSQVLDEGPIAEACARLVQSLRIGRRVTVAVCERIATPVLVGIVRPIILLPPAALTGWSPDEIEMVLLHELAHVRRWDNLVNLVQRFVESLLFFHPAVWLVSSWVRGEREACCDAVVVGRTDRPHAYAEMLVALAAQMPRSVLFHPAATSAMAARPLRGRICRILGLEDDPMLVSGKSLAVAMGGLLLVATLAVLNLPTQSDAEEKPGSTTESTKEAEKYTDLLKRSWETQNNLKNLVIALLNYADDKKRFPPRAKFDPNGKPLLSWRVLVLPYLDPDYAELYDEFHLDEPWDSEHNRKLIARMPKVFQNPQIDRPGVTNYLAVVGEECMFPMSGAPVAFQQVNDGTSQTIAIVEADTDRAVEWTRPADWEFDREQPTAGLGGVWPDGWFAAWVDGSVRSVSNIKKPDHAGIQFTRAGFETRSLSESEGRENTESRQDNSKDGGEFGGEYGGEMSGAELSLDPNFPPVEVQRLAELAATDPASTEILDNGAAEPGPMRVDIDTPETSDKNYAVSYTLPAEKVRKLAEWLNSTASDKKRVTLHWGQNKSKWVIEAPQHIHEEIADVLESVDATSTSKKFPSLEEQKLADSVWKQTGLELEPLDENDLERVRALGFAGGVRVTQNAGSKIANSPLGIEPTNILVGLHVWPTTSLADVANILSRDDLAELNPLKYYVVRAETVYESASPFENSPGMMEVQPQMKDRVVTGRIHVGLPPSTRVAETAAQGQLWQPADVVRDRPTGSEARTIASPASRDQIANAPTANDDANNSPANPTASVLQGPACFLFASDALDEATRFLELSSKIPRRDPNPWRCDPYDAEVSPAAVRKFDVGALPTYVFLQDGKEVHRLVGSQTDDQLREAIAAVETGATDNSDAVLRYNGKTWAEWRSIWRKELSTDSRRQAVRALAAFGANGKGREAAEAIVDVAPQYDIGEWFVALGPNNPEDKNVPEGRDLLLEIASVLNLGGRHQTAFTIPFDDTLASLETAARSGDVARRRFVTVILGYRHNQKSERIFLPLLIDEDVSVRNWAWVMYREVRTRMEPQPPVQPGIDYLKQVIEENKSPATVEIAKEVLAKLEEDVAKDADGKTD